jgi:CHAT domain-containing protein
MKRRRMSERSYEELFQYARSYLCTAFPNPDRRGCPADTALCAMASDPLASPHVEDHVSFCSPCFVRYMELLDDVRQKENDKAGSWVRSWNHSRVTWFGIAVLVLVAIGTYTVSKHLRQKVSGVPIRPLDAYARLELSLEPFSGSRAPEEVSPAPTSLILPRRRTDLVLQLPLGSDEGVYKLTLSAQKRAVWSATVPTVTSDHRLALETKADFRAVPSGRYILTVESPTGSEIHAPVVLEDQAAARLKRGTRAQLSSALFDTVLLTRNWVSARHRHLVRPLTGDPNKLLAEADHYGWLGNAAFAGPLYIEAEKLFAAKGDKRGELYARVGRIRATAETMPFTQVSALLQEQLEDPIVQNDPQLKLRYLTAKGYTDLDIDPLSARKEWEQAQVLAGKVGDRAREARASGELGIISFLAGDGAAAKKLVGNAFMSAVITGDVGAQVRYLSMFGNGLNQLKRFDEAVEYFNRALKLANQTPDIGFPFMAYEGKAEALIGMNSTPEAESLLTSAIDEAKRSGRRGHESQLYLVLGKTARAQGDEAAAIKHLQNAAEIARYGQFYRMDADAMFELASIYRSENKLQLAEVSLQEGISASRRIGDKFYLPRDLAGLAEIKNLQGDPKAAESLYDQASDVLDGLLINSASPYAESSIVAAMSDIYVKDFVLAARMRDIPRSFEIVERARGRSAADLLRASAQRPIGAPNETHEDRQITMLQLRLLQTTSRPERKRLLADLFDAEQKRELETSRPAMTSSTRRIRISELRRVLRSDELLLEYIVSDAGSYCLVVGNHDLGLIQLNTGRKALDKVVADYLEAMRAKADTTAQEHLLYSILLAPVREVRGKARLIIVRDGPLNLLPFDCLRDPGGRYVLYSHVTSYTPSGTVLYFLRTVHPGKNPPLPFLGIGDVNYSSGSQLLAKESLTPDTGEVVRGVYDLAGAHFPQLPNTRSEILSAEQVFGKRSVLLLGATATEAAFKAQPLSRFKVIHLAVHGFASPKYPERAALVLGQDPQGREDGLLQVREIVRLPLNADLVMLSACDTGIGRLQGEEGVVSLERAFLVAGARTVVATLWNADDTFTATLIKAFYTHLAKHEDKGSALRNAKIDMIRRFASAAAPYYWAGFTMDGDSASSISTSIQ